MSVLRSKRMIVLLAVVLVAAVGAAVGISAVVSRTVTADFTNVHFQVVHTIANDFDSGWHHHPGLAIVQVQQGSLQITQGSCTPKTVSAGETSIEIPYVPVRAVATGPVEWTTTFLLRYEEPVTIPETINLCP